MIHVVNMLATPMALALIGGIVGTLVGGVVSFKTESSERLRIGFCGLLVTGLGVAVWTTFFFQFQPLRGLRLIGIPSPVRTFVLQDGTWNEFALVSHRRFAIGVDFTVMTGVVSAPVSVPMIWRFRRRRRSQRWLLSGHCPTCNYDIRGNADRCPECGTTVAANLQS